LIQPAAPHRTLLDVLWGLQSIVAKSCIRARPSDSGAMVPRRVCSFRTPPKVHTTWRQHVAAVGRMVDTSRMFHVTNLTTLPPAPAAWLCTSPSGTCGCRAAPPPSPRSTSEAAAEDEAAAEEGGSGSSLRSPRSPLHPRQWCLPLSSSFGGRRRFGRWLSPRCTRSAGAAACARARRGARALSLAG
jgi:hypothetical protein